VATLGLDPAGVFLGKAVALAIELWLTAIVLLAGSVVVLHTALHGTLEAVPASSSPSAPSRAPERSTGRLRAVGTPPRRCCRSSACRPSHPFSSPVNAPSIRPSTEAPLLQWWVISVVALAVYLALGILLYGVLEES